MAQDYNQTLNLPKTDFPMRAGLPQREPVMLEQWEKNRLFYKMIENNEGKPLYVFHDGPPYANADIHLGTALNKVLKDVIVRYKNMTGYKCNYIPGWDCHGLPIELKAIKEIGFEEAQDPVKLRRHCREFALRHVENQKKQFKRLGTLADYDNPYLTLKPEYEALQIEIFGNMADKGYIYKDLKPVYWCADCHTALAEAEIEYQEDPCKSVYVKFPVKEDKDGVMARMGAADLSKTYVIIWTTTVWTLPGNLAICLGPRYEYVVVSANGEYYIMAKELVASTMQAAGITEYTILGSATGKELELSVCRHPFLDRDSLIIVGDHVTLDSGTGCVHTAPGHGLEDFEVCTHYPQIGMVVPVDNEGRMTAEAGDMLVGLTTEKANEVIAAKMREDGTLFAEQDIIHQYPHCWRCKDPVIYRATAQWFCSVENFKAKTVEEIEKVEYIPEWGKGRMINMVQDRSAWCLSRQRAWGVPIPAFYCGECGKPILNTETAKIVADLFRKEGSDSWYIRKPEEILPAGFACPHCGSKEVASFTKETDTMDVWFDSGVSHAATLMGEWPDQAWPCDLYLEGTDQYRGWFQSALLTAVAWKGQAPYRTVVTHGWVVDGEGRKMSKSLGNGIEPNEIIRDYGADILRLWVVSSDYHADIRISQSILKQLSEIYRKIRNTARYILGNLYDFDPVKDSVADSELLDLDKWALARLDGLLERAHRAYSRFDFHIIFHAIHNFCTIDMSNFYLDVTKDRLYVEKADSVARRAAQTAMYRILRALTTLIAPIIPFTAEEIWSYLPADPAWKSESVMFNEIPKATGMVDEAFMARWEKLIAVRDDVNKALELARTAKQIGKSLEAKVVLHCQGELLDFLRANQDVLSTIFIVSQVELTEEGCGPVSGEVESLTVEVLPAEGKKCERCWTYSPTVGESAHESLCARCAAIVG
ncbi:MAG TPA: isoleucine--tRNA ligase [Clostridiales bacterium]|nr:isoleucine--tRNA ligase [Clostridiales bacterium]